MNLNQKVNSILGLLLIIVAFLTLGTYLFVAYQSPSELLGESVNINLSQVSADDTGKMEEVVKEEYSKEKYCAEMNQELYEDSYLLTDKKHNKEIFRIQMDSGRIFEEPSIENEVYCKNEYNLVRVNDIFRWKNYLIYNYLQVNEDCISSEDNDCDIYTRQIKSYDLDTGDEKVIWEKSKLVVDSYDLSGELLEKDVEQGIGLLRGMKLIDDYLYITVHPRNLCYACGYAGLGGFTFRIDLNNPSTEELLNGIGYSEASLQEHNGKYYRVHGACTEGGCYVGDIDLYDVEKNESINIGSFDIDAEGSVSPIGFWGNKLLLSESTYKTGSVYQNYTTSLNIYMFDLSNGDIDLLYSSEYSGVALDGEYLIMYDNPRGYHFYEKGTDFEVYNLSTNEVELEFEMPIYSSFSYVHVEDRFDGNHSEIFAKLRELGFAIENESITDSYGIRMPNSAGDLFEFYFERD